jgi:hypothetical protein
MYVSLCNDVWAESRRNRARLGYYRYCNNQDELSHHQRPGQEPVHKQCMNLYLYAKGLGHVSARWQTIEVTNYPRNRP